MMQIQFMQDLIKSLNYIMLLMKADGYISLLVIYLLLNLGQLSDPLFT